MLSETILKKALAIALDQGHQFAELYLEKTSTNSIVLENNKVEKIRNGIDSGSGFRIINGEKTYYGFVNSLAEKDILKLAGEISAFAKQKVSSSSAREFLPSKAEYVPEIKLAPAQTDLTKKITILKAANHTAWDFDRRVDQVSVRYGDSEQEILVCNSNGILAKDKRVRTRLAVEVVAKQKNIMQTGYEGPGGTQGLELFTAETPERIAKTAAARAILCLEAEHAPAGPMTVVLAGSAGGTMVHEACGHALEADFIFKKTSIFTQCLGKQTVSPLITVIDDGTIPGNFGSASFDDEGTPSKKNILIEQGIVRGFMNDYLYGTLLQMGLSGNGRRESYRYVPVPRMTNTYIQAGQSNYADIVSSVANGLLVKKMGGGQVDITNGNFVFEVSEGYLLKNGKIDRPVRGATLVGNGIEVLKSVDMVGNDLHFIPGVCGKGQAAPVSDGQPTLRIPKITVGGQK